RRTTPAGFEDRQYLSRPRFEVATRPHDAGNCVALGPAGVHAVELRAPRDRFENVVGRGVRIREVAESVGGREAEIVRRRQRSQWRGRHRAVVDATNPRSLRPARLSRTRSRRSSTASGSELLCARTNPKVVSIQSITSSTSRTVPIAISALRWVSRSAVRWESISRPSRRSRRYLSASALSHTTWA